MARANWVGGVSGLRELGPCGALYPRDRGIIVFASGGFYRARGPKLCRIFFSAGRPTLARSPSEARSPLYRGRAHRLGSTAEFHLPQFKNTTGGR